VRRVARGASGGAPIVAVPGRGSASAGAVRAVLDGARAVTPPARGAAVEIGALTASGQDVMISDRTRGAPVSTAAGTPGATVTLVRARPGLATPGTGRASDGRRRRVVMLDRVPATIGAPVQGRALGVRARSSGTTDGRGTTARHALEAAMASACRARAVPGRLRAGRTRAARAQAVTGPGGPVAVAGPVTRARVGPAPSAQASATTVRRGRVGTQVSARRAARASDAVGRRRAATVVPGLRVAAAGRGGRHRAAAASIAEVARRPVVDPSRGRRAGDRSTGRSTAAIAHRVSSVCRHRRSRRTSSSASSSGAFGRACAG